MKTITLAFPIGRQKLESRTSAETGNDSPYLQHRTKAGKYSIPMWANPKRIE